MFGNAMLLRGRRAGLALMLLAAVVTACARSEASEPAVRTEWGEAVALGNGTARAYITWRGAVPEEVGVAVSEQALTGLPDAHGAGGVHVHGHTTFEKVLYLPEPNPTPFRHVLVNWNPGGHEPPGIYDLEHFDFHFYMVDNAARLAIDESDPEYQQKAERAVPQELIPQGYVLPAPLAFPRMGVHWVDPKSPELNGQKFTSTFIYGTWDGELIFAEPMITKEFLQTKQAFSAPLPAPQKYAFAGWQPTRYSVRWDEPARAYRIALNDLVARN